MFLIKVLKNTFFAIEVLKNIFFAIEVLTTHGHTSY